MNVLELFAGAGGGILGSILNGHRTVCAVEYDAYARSVLLARQNDGTFPPFPIWDDVRTFDGTPWRGIVDIVSGGFPCQDISSQGKRAGINGNQSGLWSEMARIIGEVRPTYAFIENSPELIANGLGRVLCDLAGMGFDAEWGVVSAAKMGAPHIRKRCWVLAYSKSVKWIHKSNGRKKKNGLLNNSNYWEVNRWDASKPRVCRMDDGMAGRPSRYKAIGNGQVPVVAAAAFNILMERTK